MSDHFKDIAIQKYKEEHSSFYNTFCNMLDSSVDSEGEIDNISKRLKAGVMKWSPLAYIGSLLVKDLSTGDIRRICTRRLEKFNEKKDEKRRGYYQSVISILDDMFSDVEEETLVYEFGSKKGN